MKNGVSKYRIMGIDPGTNYMGYGIVEVEGNTLRSVVMGDIDLQAKIRVRVFREWEGETHSRIIDTSVGRLIFNSKVPQDLGLVDRTNPDTALIPEVNEVCGKKILGKLVGGVSAVAVAMWLTRKK